MILSTSVYLTALLKPMLKEQERYQQKELPTPLEVNFAAIPEVLRQYPSWVVWQYRLIKGEITKPPVNLRTDRLASVTNPASWVSFEEARKAYTHGGYAGIGFVLTRQAGIVGIDIDHCIHNGEIDQDTKESITLLATYTERSPSGKGIRLFLKGSLPGPYRRKGHIELYQDGRYLTVTGQRIEGTPDTLSFSQEILSRFYNHIFQPEDDDRKKEYLIGSDKKPHRRLSDEQVLEKALRAKNGSLFQRYFAGDSSLWEGGEAKHPSRSEADFALCLMLLYWTNGDSVQADRLFRQSGLMREKWDRPTGALTYGEKTITEASRRRRQ